MRVTSPSASDLEPSPRHPSPPERDSHAEYTTGDGCLNFFAPSTPTIPSCIRDSEPDASAQRQHSLIVLWERISLPRVWHASTGTQGTSRNGMLASQHLTIPLSC